MRLRLGNQPVLSILVVSVFVLAGLLVVSPACWAQIPQEGDTTSTPKTSAGHDYIHAPLETVDPSNGSVSIRIPVRTPPGRELTIPFFFAYDSNGANYLTTVTVGSVVGFTWIPASASFSQGGWSETVPMMSVQTNSFTVPGTLPSGTPQTCGGYSNYVFQDEHGTRHDLDLAITGYTGDYEGGTCATTTGFFNATQGGEDSILATTTAPGTGQQNGALSLNPVAVTFADGTSFNFPLNVVPLVNSTGAVTWPASSITDRNGNTVSIGSHLANSNTFSYTDTAGRSVISNSGFGANPETLTVMGVGAPYTVTWAPIGSTFAASITNLYTGPGAGCPTPKHAGSSAISTLALPNGQKFSFSYDSVYGMISKITYPGGGYVRYVWGLNSQSEAGIFPNVNGCEPRYDTPAIVDRYVSYDGTHEVLHQHFVYSTTWSSPTSGNWTSKQTTVTTTDVVRNTSFQTVYTYSPMIPDFPPDVPDKLTANVPVENTVTYCDTNGAPLEAVAKTWNDPRLLASQQTTLHNGETSLTTYSYTNGEISEKDDFDFGASTVTLPSCTNVNLSGAKAGALLRKTLTSYAAFTGIHIVDRPSSVIVYNGSGTRLAETDSAYDQNGLQPTSVVQHVAAPGGSVRGNLTTVTNQCFQGTTACPQGNSKTTYTYYDTGQIFQATDPCGNATCSDVAGTTHTTTYSYTDSDSSCGGNAPPSGATNAYLTQVTFPTTTNGVSHIVSHCYDYTAGLLKSSTDENNQVTHYTYADSLDRLTEVDSPDGGLTTASYNDTPPTPSVTINKKLDTSGRFVTSVTITDGMGLPTETQLVSDPAGTDFTDTSYDGLGRPYMVTNPYRSTSDPTYGVTTYTYDALGRTTSVKHPDGSTIQTAYTNRATEVTDEGNGTKTLQRVSQTDALGRQISVCEVTSATQMGTSGTPATCGQDIAATGFITTYAYDALGNMLSAAQGSLNPRTFAYNSLSELTSASNPESGTRTYTYDANGNLASRKAPAPNQTGTATVTTTYAYDSLNRPTQESYSDGTTPPANYTYDINNAWGVTETNTVGRLVLKTTGTGPQTGSVFSYDSMGRPLNNWQCTPIDCGAGAFQLNYLYDLLGDVTSAANGEGVTLTSAYNTAAQLTTLTSSLSDANHPGTLLSNLNYNALGATSSSIMGNGVGETLGYTTRGWLNSISAVTAATPTKSTGSVTITGTEQSFTPVCGGGGGGNTATVGTGSGSGSSGNVTLPPPCPPPTVYDTGTVSITVNGFTATATYGQFSTAASVASALANALNASGSPVTATSSGGTVNLTSIATGGNANYLYSTTSATNDPTDFSFPSFSSGPANGAMTGGGVSGGATVYAMTIPASGFAPDGDIVAANDSVNGNWNYAYDDFNRLCAANQGGQTPLTCTSANTTGQVAYTYAYDRFGNRWKQTLTAGSGGTSSVTFSGNNNRIDGYSYDAAGNLLSDGVHTYAYDAENRIISVDSGAATYVYDADGQRVRKTVGGASTDYLYDLAGHAITEVGASGWQRGEVYAGGRHVATYVNGTTYFAHMDWLGTERVHTAVSGAVCETVKSLPFGDGEAATGSCDPTTRHFTGKMRDAETNLDNFEARYYSSALGRFMIPDWDAKATAVPYAAYGNPQTLNLYGYVGNNPITETDATGHAGESPSFPISQAEPLDVTGQDNAHWEPQLDIDPELKGGSIIPMFVDEDVSSTDPTTVVAFAAGISLTAVGNTQAALVSLPQGLKYTVAAPGPNSPPVHPLFAPDVAEHLAAAIKELNEEGIVPQINSAFRTSDEQVHEQLGGSGSNPAASTSWHEAGGAVDINGTKSPQFKSIIAAMEKHGFVWGGTFKSKVDPPHFDARKFMGNLKEAVAKAQGYWTGD